MIFSECKGKALFGLLQKAKLKSLIVRIIISFK